MDWSQLSVDHLHAKRQRVQTVAQMARNAHQAHARAVYAAYAWLGSSAEGELILHDLTERFVLQQCHDAYQEGARRLVLELYKIIAEAPAKLREPE